MNPQPTTSDKSSHQGTGAIKDLERGTNVSKAVRLLYKLYSERLRYLGWKLCGSDADEVVDEAFIYGVKAIQTGMFRSPDGRRPSKAFLGFLRSLLKNKAISWLRKKTADKRPQERNRVPLDVIQTEAERPEVQIDFRDFLEYLLKLLPAEGHLREIAVQWLVEEHSPKEIAESLSMPLPTMYRRLHEIRRILKPHLPKIPNEVSNG